MQKLHTKQLKRKKSRRFSYFAFSRLKSRRRFNIFMVPVFLYSDLNGRTGFFYNKCSFFGVWNYLFLMIRYYFKFCNILFKDWFIIATTCSRWNIITDFSSYRLNDYIHWYNRKRIKLSLGEFSPFEHSQYLGLIT